MESCVCPRRSFQSLTSDEQHCTIEAATELPLTQNYMFF
jgi:hypothetical protein